MYVFVDLTFAERDCLSFNIQSTSARDPFVSSEKLQNTETFCLSRIFMAWYCLVDLCWTSITRPNEPVPRVRTRTKSSNVAWLCQWSVRLETIHTRKTVLDRGSRSDRVAVVTRSVWPRVSAAAAGLGRSWWCDNKLLRPLVIILIGRCGI